MPFYKASSSIENIEETILAIYPFYFDQWTNELYNYYLIFDNGTFDKKEYNEHFKCVIFEGKADNFYHLMEFDSRDFEVPRFRVRFFSKTEQGLIFLKLLL